MPKRAFGHYARIEAATRGNVRFKDLLRSNTMTQARTLHPDQSVVRVRTLLKLGGSACAPAASHKRAEV